MFSVKLSILCFKDDRSNQITLVKNYVLFQKYETVPSAGKLTLRRARRSKRLGVAEWSVSSGKFLAISTHHPEEERGLHHHDEAARR